MTTRLPAIAVVLAGIGALSPAYADAPEYDLVYRLDLSDPDKPARASLTVDQQKPGTQKVRFDPQTERFTDFEATSGLQETDSGYTWTVPTNGGTLSWTRPLRTSAKTGVSTRG